MKPFLTLLDNRIPDTISLNGQWQGICYRDGEEFSFTGTVPGCVHTDLQGSKLPEDLFYRDNAELCQWIETCDFRYTRTFTMDNLPESAALVFEGLDVYADITFNGAPLASTDNMFIDHRFDVTGLLQQGENTLSVYFRSPVKAVEELPQRKGAFTRERMYTRRIQGTYGWDWVARFVTCGIFKDVYLDCTNTLTPEHIYVYTESFGTEWAQIAVEAEFKNYENGGYVDLDVNDPDGILEYRRRWYRKESRFKEYIHILFPQLWYPNGYGEQPLYTLTLCGKTVSFGIRTAQVLEEMDNGNEYDLICRELVATPSGKAYDHNTPHDFTGFQLMVNGTPIFCKGANWVPCEPFPSAETDEKITTLLELAKDAGVNMLRVWGGGIFERDHFYDECDRLGILVTQDFLMACGHYPEEDPLFIQQLQKEAKHAALRLRNHPSLVWWSGDNENAVRGSDIAEDYTGRTAIEQGIKPILEQYDPRRRFFNSSPYGGNTYASKTAGTTHNTQFLGQFFFPYILNTDMTDYKDYFKELLARFIAEEPTMGAACLPSLRRFMTEEDIFGDTAMWEYHTKNNPGLKTSLWETLQQFTQKILGEFTDGQDRLFKLKYAQYEWLRFSMELARRKLGFCNGIIYWMWNDCWPAAAGWSIVDYYCLPKAAYYSFKRCASDLVVSITKEDGYHNFYLCHNANAILDVTLRFYLISGNTATLLAECPNRAMPYSILAIHSRDARRLKEGDMLVVDILHRKRLLDRASYKEGTLHLVPTDAVTLVSRNEDSVTVTASSYVHAVELEGEYIFEDNYFSLLPGETRTIPFRKAAKHNCEDIQLHGYTLKQ